MHRDEVIDINYETKFFGSKFGTNTGDDCAWAAPPEPPTHVHFGGLAGDPEYELLERAAFEQRLGVALSASLVVATPELQRGLPLENLSPDNVPDALRPPEAQRKFTEGGAAAVWQTDKETRAARGSVRTHATNHASVILYVERVRSHAVLRWYVLKSSRRRNRSQSIW